MKKIFVTAIGGDIGYGVIKALRESKKELHIIGCDIERYNVSYEIVDEFYVCPPYTDFERWSSFVREVIAEKQVDYFWPVTETEINLTMDYPELFENVKVIRNDDNILKVALSKWKTVTYLQSVGINVPQTINTDDWNNHKFPVIVKSEYGCGSHNVRVVNDPATLKEVYSRMENPIIQECIGSADDEYTMAIFSDGKVINNITFKRRLGFGGMSRYVELVKGQELDDIATTIAKSFDLKGSINVQMRKAEGKYYVFEINPRISSTISFRAKIGFNDVAWWIDMLEGVDVAQYVCPEGKVHGVRSVEEKIFFE